MLVRAGEDFTHIVSLTSYPKRIRLPEVPVVLYSIIRQKTRARFRLVLVLSRLEFPKGLDELPESIQAMAKTGVCEVIWTADNLKAAKKLWPVMAKYPGKPIMTTDDDIVLDADCVERFVEESRKHPGCILTEEGYELEHTGDIITGHFRYFPVGSLLELPTKYFVDCYGTLEDDAYNAYLAHLKGTRTIILHTGKTHVVETGGFLGSAFNTVYRKVDPVKCREKLGKMIKENHEII